MASQHFGTSTKIDPILGKSTPFFFCISVFFHNHSRITSQDFKGRGGHFFNSSLPLPPASQTLRHQLDNYRRELTSAHRQQPDSNQDPLVSECKLLTTKLRTLYYAYCKEIALLLIFHIRCILGNIFERIKSNQEQQVINWFFFADSVMKLMILLKLTFFIFFNRWSSVFEKFILNDVR